MTSPTEFNRMRAELHEKCGWDYLYRQLAEECAELNHAALKFIRSVKKETPLPLEEAAREYVEELADVWLMIAIARTDMTEAEKKHFDETVAFKGGRLFERMAGK